VNRVVIATDLVERLVADQFPELAHWPVRTVDVDGWDNRTFRLGDSLLVRLPTAAGYVAQVDKEHAWLPVLRPALPVSIPEPLARGRPGHGYRWPWSIYRWIDGSTATPDCVADPVEFAVELATFLRALHIADPTAGPHAGLHNAFRGAHPDVYDADTRAALTALSGLVDIGTSLEVWEAALAEPWSRPPVWVHGDLTASNLLVRDGRLAAVIDFGCCAVGDPACDLVMAWTFFDDEGRRHFRGELGLDDATWARGRGWALWKALLVAADEHSAGVRADAATRRFGWTGTARQVVDIVINDHRAEG
jgi:aminoglycoside phosphotransferase (APT) family kinase protein